jgi:hypothetical protein
MILMASNSGTPTIKMPSAAPGIPYDLALTDEKLAAWLKAQQEDKKRVTLVHAKHLCAFLAEDDLTAKLIFADADAESLAVLLKMARKAQVFIIGVNFDELFTSTIATSDWITRAVLADQEGIKQWHKSRQNLFKEGRGKSLQPRDERKVWYEAGARCMYYGCGKDLGHTSLTEKSAPAAYLAHIVASDADGPRGDPVWSHELSDDPNNVMLMCDEHHRLIDRIDVAGHSRAVLDSMRAEHVGKIRDLLRSLRYPHSRGLALLADVGNIKTSFQPRDMREAMLGMGLSPEPEIDQLVRRFQRDDRLSPDYWQWVLHEHENDFGDLMRRLGSTQALGDRVEVISAFPLHLVPILVLCGRIVGEARAIQVFQYSRGRSWQWSSTAMPHADGFFFLDGTNDISKNQYSQAVLSIELTAEIDVNALPDALMQDIATGSIPWIRIRAMQPDNGCIAHPQDLEQFTATARKALRFIQDVLRVPNVHLIGVSPASTLFRFGQILQAGHHPDYIVYDRPDWSKPFNPALCITGQKVHEATTGGAPPKKTLNLR